MKMQKNMTCCAPFSRQRNKASGNYAFAMAALADYNGGAFTKTVIDATMCAIIA